MKIGKRILCVFVTLSMMLSFSLIIYAWTPPKLKNPYVEPDVQFRSVWVCTVSNMDVKAQNGTDEGAINKWKEQYLTILNNSVEMGMNAIIFQVSPSNDAFYPSKYKPWSQYLAGFGVDPGWDPVEWMIEVTHEAGLEYHAWFNPYRTSTTALSYNITETDKATGSSYIGDYDKDTLYNYKQDYFAELKRICEKNGTLVDNPIFATGAQLDHNVLYGSEEKFVLNPASETTIKHIEDTMLEFITNYDVDGIHFDDYFYPDDKNYKGSNAEYKKNTFSTEPDVDMKDYNAYLENGGQLSVYDWRRENVNNLIERLGAIVRESNKTDDYKCAFGISPSARWAPSPESCPAGSSRPAEGGMDAGCNDYYSYSDLYADTRKWALEGWIDYILPQNYTYMGDTPAGIPDGKYPVITKWWSETLADSDCKLYIGTALYQISSWISSQAASSDEFLYQQKYNQDKGYDVDGYVMFRYDSMLTGSGLKAMNKVLASVWTVTALTPTYPAYTYDSVDEAATIDCLKLNADGSYTLEFNAVDDAKAYAILADGKAVSRVLRNATSIVFNKEEGKTYTFVTYGYDNQVHKDSYEIDFSDVKVNQQPTVEFTSKLNKEYLISSEIAITIKVNDPENDSITYSISFVSDGRERALVNDVNLTGDTINYTYTCYAYEQDECYFIVKVNDSFGIVELESEKFAVVKEEGVVTPPKHEHVACPECGKCTAEECDGVASEKCEGHETKTPSTGGMACSMTSVRFISIVISITTLFSLVFRKRD